MNAPCPFIQRQPADDDLQRLFGVVPPAALQMSAEIEAAAKRNAQAPRSPQQQQQASSSQPSSRAWPLGTQALLAPGSTKQQDPPHSVVPVGSEGSSTPHPSMCEATIAGAACVHGLRFARGKACIEALWWVWASILLQRGLPALCVGCAQDTVPAGASGKACTGAMKSSLN